MLCIEVKTEGTNMRYDVIMEMRMDYLQIMKYVIFLHLTVQI